MYENDKQIKNKLKKAKVKKTLKSRKQKLKKENQESICVVRNTPQKFPHCLGSITNEKLNQFQNSFIRITVLFSFHCRSVTGYHSFIAHVS